MSRIPVPSSIETAPQASQTLLQGVKQQLGVAPNLFRMVGNSPAALEGYVGLLGALGKGRLPIATRQRIALAVAEVNACSYCLSAHTHLGKALAKLDDSEMLANRSGHSLDARANVAVEFAVKVTRQRGQVADAELQALRSAGYDDAQIVEIVLHVALNTWTNYINLVAQTPIDFDVVPVGAAG